MSYRMRLSERSRKAGRFISRVHRDIQKAFTESGMKQQELAQKLGVDRSIVNRRLSGEANLTLRSLADLAWAFEKEIHFSMTNARAVEQANEFTLNTRTKIADEHLQQKSNVTQSQNGVALVDA